MEIDEEANRTVVSKGPCPDCDTTKGNVTYADGHQHCFACGTTRRGDGDVVADSPREPREPVAAAGLIPRSQALPTSDLKKRGLRAETLSRFGYFTAGFSGQTVHVAPYHDQAGKLVAQKLRFPDKSFVVLPKGTDINEMRLFGHHVWGDQFDMRVVVTEGELDALSVAQELSLKSAVVSVNSGAGGAVKNVKANYLWLDRFKEIILWFDDDEPGREAAAKVAALFKVGKVRVAKAEGAKDASDLLQQNRPGDITPTVFSAQAWRPAGIVNAADNPEDVIAPKPESLTSWHYDWPWASLQDTLGPLLPGQVCYHVAGTGIGKTTGMAEVEFALLKQGCKVGHMGFEDTRRDVKLRLMSIHVSRRLDIDPLADDEMVKLHQEVFAPRLVELFDPETAEWTVDAILGYVRYCAKALDCRVVFIDPLTFIAAGLDLSADERRALDKASRDIAAMAKELGIHIQVAHHLKRPEGTAHEEGAATSLNEVRGSGGIANFASFVIGHERNQQAEGDTFLLTQLRALKNRPRSKTGPLVVLRYDMATGRLKETAEPFPGAGDKRARGPARSPFSETPQDY